MLHKITKECFSLCVLLGILGASLLGNMWAGKGYIWASDRVASPNQPVRIIADEKWQK